MTALLLIAVPYAAAVLFLGGLTWRVWRWAATPVPFRIPTTCGQQRSLEWIRPGRLESPSTALGVTARVLLEVLLFRSLFRNSGSGIITAISRPSDKSVSGGVVPDPRMTFVERKGLWLGALAFHWALLVILLRHVRLFVEPVPRFATSLTSLDGVFQLGAPTWYATDVIVVVALTYLLGRRLRDPLLRYLTLPADYLVLGLLLAVVGTGLVTRYLARPDLVAIKQFTLGLAALSPAPPPWPGPWFVLHLLCVSLLLAVFPASKLVHGAGAWLSPTRNQANDSRRRRHVNPWNAPVQVHTYQEWEAEFRDKIRVARLPLDQQQTPAAGPSASTR